MIRVALAFVLTLFSLQAQAQGMYGFDVGLGKATLGKSYSTPVVSGYYLKKLSRTFYLGVAVAHQRYSFSYNYNKASSSLNYDEAISVRSKSSYLFASPKFDVGIGYRKYLHFFGTFGPGLLLGGNQVSYTLKPYQTLPSGTTATDTAGIITSGDVPRLISRYSMGASWRIPTGRYWNIMLSAEYNVIPSSLNNNDALKTNFLCFTIGIMHKYPMTFVEY